MLQFVGFDVLAPQVVYGSAHLTDEQRKQHLEDYAARLRGIDRESPIDVGIY
jgi:NAD(P)H dehydrogenase (quinone)